MILVSASCRINHLVSIAPSSYRMDSLLSVSPDRGIDSLIYPYKVQLDAEMNQVIGYVEKEMTKGQPESSLGNWVADALQAEAESYSGREIDFTVQNHGGIRIPSLARGPVSRGKIFELMPFDNLITLLEMDGNSVRVLVEHMAAEGGWPISRTLGFTLAAGGRVTDITIRDKALDPQGTYLVCVPDYVANGGSDCSFLRGLPRQDLPYLIRDALIAFIAGQTREGKAIYEGIDGRVKIQ